MYIEQFGKCPMCSAELVVGDLVVVDDTVSKARQPKMSASQAIEDRHLTNG
jgi:hypothetical protein